MVTSHVGHTAFHLLVRLDARSRVSLQQQVYTAIRRAILDGLLRPGTKLPSTRALALDLAVSRTTTLLAYEQLAAEGYLTSRSGSGTFVASDLPDDSARMIVPRTGTRAVHPTLSRRGALLAATPAPSYRIVGPPKPFRIGVPALDLFPARVWSRLATRIARSTTRDIDLDYGDARGLPRLREAIAQHVELSRGTRCHADQVLVVGGAQRGIELMCRLLLDPGDAAWLEEPGYPGARSALISADARIVPVRVDEDGIDVSAGMRVASGARLAYVTPSHQFPLGVYMSLARRLALLRWARDAGAWIIEDDYDSDFRYQTRPIPALHGLDADGRVIYVGSFSKSLFPALRLGFVIVPPGLMSAVLDVRRASDVHPSTLIQAVVSEFMTEGYYERHLRRMRSVYRARLEALQDSLQRYCTGALRLRPTKTGLHAVADLVGTDAESVTEECAARDIEVTPLARYFMSDIASANAIVLGFAAVPPRATKRGAQALANAIDVARRQRAPRADRTAGRPTRTAS